MLRCSANAGASSKSRLEGGAGGAADYYARTRAGLATVLLYCLTADEGRVVAGGGLHQARHLGGQIVDHLGMIQTETIEIDQVDIRLHPGLERAAIVHAEEARSVLGEFLNDELERQMILVAPGVTAHPMGQH